MSKLTEIFAKIRRKWTKIRLQPIRVFCCHHVSDVYEASYMWECDWVNTEALKQWIEAMQLHGYTFISLAEAHNHIGHDTFRFNKYAVLTADDGFKTILNILPWLIEQQIPITIFVNPKYILYDAIGDNVQTRLVQTKGKISTDELYLNTEDIQNVSSPLVTFAYHGYEHLDEWNMDDAVFDRNVEKCIEAMRNKFPNVIPFYAHTYGHSKPKNDKFLLKIGVIPVYVSGNKNYNDTSHIDRELISNERLEKGLLR